MVFFHAPRLSLCVRLCSAVEQKDNLHCHDDDETSVNKDNDPRPPHSVDGTHSLTSTVPDSVSLLPKSGPPRIKDIGIGFKPLSLGTNEDDSGCCRRFKPKKNALKRWLRHTAWTKLNDEDGQNGLAIKKTTISDAGNDDGDGDYANEMRLKGFHLGLRFRRYPAPLERRMKPAKFFPSVVKKGGRNHLHDRSTEESNLLESDTDEHILREQIERQNSTFKVSGVTGNVPVECLQTGNCHRTPHEMFDTVLRVIDKELLDMSALNSQSSPADGDMVQPVSQPAEVHCALGLERQESAGVASLRNGTEFTRTSNECTDVNTTPPTVVLHHCTKIHAPDGLEEKECNDENLNHPPVLEISDFYTRDPGDYSVSQSDVSSLSGSIQFPLEFSLETGVKGGNKQLVTMVTEIAKCLARAERHHNPEISSRCLILLMDPSKRMFEIIQVPFILESSTIGEILARLPIAATDRRLASVDFCGFSCNGILFSAPMVPMQLVLAAQSKAKPLFAVPVGYSANQIEALGNSLLRSPHVAKLLHDKLANVRRETGDSTNLDTPIKVHVQTSRRHLPVRPLGVITEY